MEEASLGPQWCCSLGVACLQGMILVPKAKKMPMVTIPSPKTQARREALFHGLFFQGLLYRQEAVRIVGVGEGLVPAGGGYVRGWASSDGTLHPVAGGRTRGRNRAGQIVQAQKAKMRAAEVGPASAAV